MPWEATLAAVVRTLNIFGSLNLDRRIDRVKIDAALQTLRQIFFYSSELTRVLEDIEAGREIEPEIINYFADEYRAVPLHLQSALSFIENHRFEDRNALIIDDIELMNQIRNGKIDTRSEISSFFSNYRQEIERGNNRISVDAGRILGQIERLNTSIKTLERRLLAAHKSDATSSPRRTAPRARRRVDRGTDAN